MIRQQAWNIFRGGRWCDTVYFDLDMGKDDVKRSLIDHDGFPCDIRVQKEKA